MSLIHSKSRLESFSDSVFAFAATLLVVSLEVPDNFALLKEQLSGFYSFGLSFLALVLIWRVHYNFFRRIEQVNNWIIGLNMCLLFTILYFVYPLKFLTSLPIGKSPLYFDDLAILFQLYSLGFTLIFVCIAAMYWAAARMDIHQNVGRMLGFYKRHFYIFIFVGILSITLAFLKVGIPYGVPGFAYPLLGPLCFWHGKVYEKDLM